MVFNRVERSLRPTIYHVTFYSNRSVRLMTSAFNVFLPRWTYYSSDGIRTHISDAIGRHPTVRRQNNNTSSSLTSGPSTIYQPEPDDVPCTLLTVVLALELLVDRAGSDPAYIYHAKIATTPSSLPAHIINF